MSRRNYTNNAPATALTANATASDTAVNVSSLTGFPGSYPYTVVLDANTAAAEVVLVTSASGTVATVVRGFDGTAAISHLNGATFQHAASAIDFNEANAHVNATSGVHGVTGALVGVDSIQTLTNKTLSSPTLDTPTITNPVVLPSGSSDIANFKNGASTAMRIANDGSILLDPLTTAVNPLLAHRQRGGSMTQDFVQWQDSSGTPVVLASVDAEGDVFANGLKLKSFATTTAATAGIAGLTAGSIANIAGRAHWYDGAAWWPMVKAKGNETTANITGASGSIDPISHGLGTTPNRVFIQLRGNPNVGGTGPYISYVSNITSTQFTVYFGQWTSGGSWNPAALGQSVVFDWEAKV